MADDGMMMVKPTRPLNRAEVQRLAEQYAGSQDSIGKRLGERYREQLAGLDKASAERLRRAWAVCCTPEHHRGLAAMRRARLLNPD